MAEVQARLQSLSEDYTKLQQELQTAVQSQQKLEAQKQENTNVQKVSLIVRIPALSVLTCCT